MVMSLFGGVIRGEKYMGQGWKRKDNGGIASTAFEEGSFYEAPGATDFLKYEVRLMDEILHHLGCIKPCK